ncbi:hypothetical protein [Estrella lausannensis]|uniref:Putative secreted protein n=1 Tax=Estrella lausannensis TaxID=483423 RepID=A0A0H5DQI0_9BACT|nr:hypothetical protein [Estrella lausannensis]CRX37819.1 putative secreted protein [Estrella lausannensis]
MINLFLSTALVAGTLFANTAASSTLSHETTERKEAIQEGGLRMGFNHGTHEISILFPKEHALKYLNTEEGKQIYHSQEPYQEQFISYQFAYQGFLVDGLSAFKQNYLANVQESMKKKNPRAEGKVILDEKRSPNRQRTIIEQVSETGKRTVFVADFITIEDRVYLVSEMIEASQFINKETAELIDEAFFESINLN